jgi:signal transduction histidine kinase
MAIDRKTLSSSWRSYWSQDMTRSGPYWMQLLWTLLISAGVGVLFTIVGFLLHAKTLADWLNPLSWLYWFGKNFIVSLTIAALIHVLFEIATAAFTPRRIRAFTRHQRTAFFGIIPLVGVYIGWPMGYWLAGGNMRDMFGSINSIVGSLFFASVVTTLMGVYWNSRHREMQATAKATEARLRSLQAQIEPHFLFNTLANVVSLIDHDAPRAKQMLESFIDYLRASLTQLRRDDSTLGAELDMAAAYLDLLGTRMADRLRYRIEATDASRAALVPPLLLQPLVENAIQHGLEPKIEGGQVIIRADIDGERLRLSVQDDGLGLNPNSRTAGNGLAMNNIRERLSSRYGSDAELVISPMNPGVLATLTLPYTTTPP